MFLLIPGPFQHRLVQRLSLHSTMFLLIQGTGKVCAAAAPYFTFHDVSINTAAGKWIKPVRPPLHSTMFLLIRSQNAVSNVESLSLHSTMFLLIRIEHDDLVTAINFTFHDVSINTRV